MKALAEALVLAILQIELRQETDENTDSDIDALESIAAILQAASNSEKIALISEIKEVLAEKKKSPLSNEKAVDCLRSLAENFDVGI